MKALNPADPNIKVAKLPGGSTLPSVTAYTEQYITVNPTMMGAKTAEKWDMEVFLRQDPVIPLAIRVKTVENTFYYPVINNKYAILQSSAIHRATQQEINASYAKFRSGRQAYRITAESVTGILVASALTNSGRIVASQYSLPCMKGHMITPYRQLAADAPVSWGAISYEPTTNKLDRVTTQAKEVDVNPSVLVYTEGPWSQDALLQATTAYIGEAKDGFYMPLKLNNYHKMINLNKYKLLGGNNSWINIDQSNGQLRYVYCKQNEDTITSRPPFSAWPYYGDWNQSSAPTATDNYGYNPGFVIGIDTAANIIGHTAVTGLDPQASYSLTLRLGVEFAPELGSPEAAYTTSPVLPDPVAITAYNEISARLPDAFPADYNDSGKLGKWISDIGKKILPVLDVSTAALSQIPGLVGGIAKGANTVVRALANPPPRPALTNYSNNNSNYTTPQSIKSMNTQQAGRPALNNRRRGRKRRNTGISSN